MDAMREAFEAWFAEAFPVGDVHPQSLGAAMRELAYKAWQAATLAERSRAAQIVETWADDHLTVQPSFTGMAAAIRDQQLP